MDGFLCLQCNWKEFVDIYPHVILVHPTLSSWLSDEGSALDDPVYVGI
jgi:hypothetical protein